MWKIFKIILIVLFVIILLLGLLLGFAYVKDTIKENNLEKWTYCEADEDCVLAKSYKYCACGSFSINKMYEEKYNEFLVKEKERQRKSYFQMMCETCMLPEIEMPKCIKNKCYAFSDNNHELKLLNMT